MRDPIRRRTRKNDGEWLGGRPVPPDRSSDRAAAPVISVGRLIERLGPDGPDRSIAAELVRAATGYVEERTGRCFSLPVRREERFIGNGSPLRWLSEVPTGRDVTVREAHHLGADTVDVANFVVRGAKLVRTWPGMWEAGRVYTVGYVTGYDPDTAPAAVREAVAMLATAMWREIHRPAPGGHRHPDDRSRDDVLKVLAEEAAGRIPFVENVIHSHRRLMA